MKDSTMFDHRPDPEFGAALRAALEPRDDHSAFVGRVMAGYDEALRRATVPTWEVLASWFRPGVAAATAALLAGFLIGRTVFFAGTAGGTGAAAVSMDAAIASAAVGGPGRGVAALVTAPSPPDPSIVFTSLVEQR